MIRPDYYSVDGKRDLFEVMRDNLRWENVDSSPVLWETFQSNRGFLIGNIIKYNTRAGKKDSSTKEIDLEKSKTYQEELKIQTEIFLESIERLTKIETTEIEVDW